MGPVGPPGPSVYVPADGLSLAVLAARVALDRSLHLTVVARDGAGAVLPASALDRLRVTVAAVASSTTGDMLDGWRSYVLCPASPAPKPCNESVVQAGLLAASATVAPEGAIAYTLRASAPPDFSSAARHRFSVEGRRTFAGVTRAAEAHLDVVPGGAAAPTRAEVTEGACNGCHGGLAVHGGNRGDVDSCVTCHTDQLIDPGAGPLAFERLVHKIHRGAALPSVLAGVPFGVSGFMGAISDFSTVEFPRDIRDCSACHAGPDGGRFATRPGLEACSSCHDRTWFGAVVSMPSGFRAHTGGVQPDSTMCRGCHPEQGGIAGVRDVHRKPADLPGAPTFALTITAVSAQAGRPPVIDFTMADRGGTPIADPAAVARLAATFAGPTTDYTTLTQATVRGGGASGRLINLGAGAYRYTFTSSIPAGGPGGTWAFGLEGYRSGILPDGTTFRYGAVNPVAYAAPGGGAVAPRRVVVETARCDACHQEVAAHGNNRDGNVQYCVLCHNPTATDAAQRPANAGPPTSIDFKVMIHKIHRGADLPSLAAGGPRYVIYGFGRSANDFSDVGFPADLRACTLCHAPGTARATSTAVCTSCHDDQGTAGHAALNTTAAGVETCAVCHGPGAAFAVDKVHAP